MHSGPDILLVLPRHFLLRSSVEDLTTFQARRDKKFPNQPGAGHVYVKLTGNALKPNVKPRAQSN